MPFVLVKNISYRDVVLAERFSDLVRFRLLNAWIVLALYNKQRTSHLLRVMYRTDSFVKVLIVLHIAHS